MYHRLLERCIDNVALFNIIVHAVYPAAVATATNSILILVSEYNKTELCTTAGTGQQRTATYLTVRRSMSRQHGTTVVVYRNSCITVN